jgi:hypothetical protein
MITQLNGILDRKLAPWGFGQVLLKGVVGVAKKSRGGPYFRVLLHFYDQVFQTLPPSLRAFMQ